MKLDYGTQLSPEPIVLSIGTIRKPRLKNIAQITFGRFMMYEVFLKATPEIFYTKLLENGSEIWDSFTEAEKTSMTMYNLIERDDWVREIFEEIFCFFFEDKVAYREGFFIVFDRNIEPGDSDIPVDSIRGVITDKLFSQVVEIIQQVCCIYDEEKEEPAEIKFKNSIAKAMYERMQKAQKEMEQKKKETMDKNHSIPNIISAVASRHPSINFVNIWELTIFQLLDCFNRLQANAFYEIGWTRTAVWGDEKKTFDPSLWYQNNHDK